VTDIRRVLVALGTRPEAIKLAPVIRALRLEPGLDVRVLATAQHRQLLDQALAPFDLVPDVDLDLMRDRQQLASLTARVLERVDDTLASWRPDLLIVQGDTTTVFAASLAAFYRGVAVGHVEAGLRTGDLSNPFPEEANRHLTGVLATLHFAPTERARAALLSEGAVESRIVVTGNTVVDALRWIIDRHPPGERPGLTKALPEHAQVLLVTIHRRESWGRDTVSVCDALRALVSKFPDAHVILPVHPNPAVSSVVTAALGDLERIHLTPPLDYVSFVQLLRRARLVLTDSGGVLEEAASLGLPALVLRKHTERPEACESGAAELVGTDTDTIVAAGSRLLTVRPTASTATAASPYGDGRASERIATVVRRWFEGRVPLLDPYEAFAPGRSTPRA
jgi:UDP-N-acetylglucosamine 2-epimerase (non-hydrolysing)